MIYISAKDIEDLNEEKLRTFLHKKHRENRFLDYKLKYHKKSVDEAKTDFLEDVSSFANSYGGNIIIGVKESKEEGESSQPGELVGISDGDKEAVKYRDRCDDSIDPPIPGLVIKEIYLENNKWAIVIYVPVSLRRPHMVTFKGKNRFHIRRDDRTLPMTIDEVKRTVMEVVNLENNLDSYVNKIEEELTEDFLQDDFSLIMHIVPYLLDEDQVDTSSERIIKTLHSNKKFPGTDFGFGSAFVPMPNIHGIFSADNRNNPTYKINVHRTGYVGLEFNLKEKLSNRGITDKILYPWIKDCFLNILNLSRIITEKSKISSPYQIRCKFINAEGAIYQYYDGTRHLEKSDIIWKRQILRLPGIRIDSFQDIEKVADSLFERLRNAFGLPYLDTSGC